MLSECLLSMSMNINGHTNTQWCIMNDCSMDHKIYNKYDSKITEYLQIFLHGHVVKTDLKHFW